MLTLKMNFKITYIALNTPSCPVLPADRLKCIDQVNNLFDWCTFVFLSYINLQKKTTTDISFIQ